MMEIPTVQSCRYDRTIEQDLCCVCERTREEESKLVGKSGDIGLNVTGNAEVDGNTAYLLLHLPHHLHKGDGNESIAEHLLCQTVL